MSNLTIFNFEGQQVRFVGTEDQPEWIAQDVCAVLDIKDHAAAIEKFDDDERGTTSILTLGGKQNMLTVTEPGLYRLIFRSDKPKAKKFQKWVFSDVLPEIRKTGRYETMPDGIMSIAELNAYGKELQKSGALLDKAEKAKYATEVSKSFAYRTGTQPIDHTLTQAKIIEGIKSEYQVFLDKIVEHAKRKNRAINARDMTGGVNCFRKISSDDIRKMFSELAKRDIGHVTGTAKDLKYVYSDPA